MEQLQKNVSTHHDNGNPKNSGSQHGHKGKRTILYAYTKRPLAGKELLYVDA